MNIANAHTAWAATCDTDRNLIRDLDARVTRQVLEDAPLEVIIEAGCGTGKNTHHISEFLGAARQCGLGLLRLDESWHPEDASTGVPRLVSLVFTLKYP